MKRFFLSTLTLGLALALALTQTALAETLKKPEIDKLMPNAINFGPAMPGKKYTAHNANEFKQVTDLDADMQMFTEMLVPIGNLKQMQ